MKKEINIVKYMVQWISYDEEGENYFKIHDLIYLKSIKKETNIVKYMI